MRRGTRAASNLRCKHDMLMDPCGRADHVAGAGMGMRGGAVCHNRAISAGAKP